MDRYHESIGKVCFKALKPFIFCFAHFSLLNIRPMFIRQLNWAGMHKRMAKKSTYITLTNETINWLHEKRGAPVSIDFF